MAMQIFKNANASKEGYKQTYGINNASVLKRAMAFLVDLILLIVLATGLLYVSGKVFDYDGNYAKLEEKYEYYGIYTGTTTDGVKDACVIEYNEDGSIKEDDPCYLNWKAFNADEEAMYYRTKCDNLMLLMLSSSTFLAVIILEFILPLIFKNGRTLGSLLMHIGLIRSDGVKATPVQLFARAVIGRWGIETMIPLLSFAFAMVNPSGGLMGMIIIFVFLIIETICIGFTKNHTSIHDLIPGLVCVDNDSQFYANDIGELLRMKESVKTNK